jgi:hypothetical protein
MGFGFLEDVGRHVDSNHRTLAHVLDEAGGYSSGSAADVEDVVSFLDVWYEKCGI